MNHKISHSIFVAICFFSLKPSFSLGKELLGKIAFSEILLEPYFQLDESKKGAFNLGRYLLGLKWDSLADWQANIVFGSCRLIDPPRWYSKNECALLGLTAAFVEWRSPLGAFSVGLIPLSYGIEGGNEELNLLFPRSIVYQEGYLYLRDVGLRYEIAYHQYFTNLSLVNGEAGEDRDSNLWLISQWGWGVNKPFRIGFGGQTGYTGVGASNPENSRAPISGFDINSHSKIRFGQFFARQSERTWSLAMEINFGEALQDQNQTQFVGGHLDGTLHLGEHWGVMARYDQIDRSRSSGDATFETSVGLFINGLFKVSNLHFILRRRANEGQLQALHEGLILLKISPTYSADH